MLYEQLQKSVSMKIQFSLSKFSLSNSLNFGIKLLLQQPTISTIENAQLIAEAIMLSTFGDGMFHTQSDVCFQLFISPGALTSYSVIYDIYAIRRMLNLTLAMTFIS